MWPRETLSTLETSVPLSIGRFLHPSTAKRSHLATTARRLKPAAIVRQALTSYRNVSWRRQETRQRFAAWTCSKSLLLVLSVNASAKVRVIVLGKCHRADRAALVSHLFVQFCPFSSVCLKQIQCAFAALSFRVSCMPASGLGWLLCCHEKKDITLFKLISLIKCYFLFQIC